MIRLPALSPLPVLLLLAACGPGPGDSCKGGGYLCHSEKEALECRDGKWRALPCKGPSGCTQSGDSIRCDMSTNVNGDNCALSAEGRGLCTPDGKAVLECRMGVLVQTKTCNTCTSDGMRITCQP